MTACARTNLFRNIIVHGLMPLAGMAAGMMLAIGAWPRVSDRLWPASSYYEMTDVVVETADDLRDYIVHAVRDIHQPFDGRYETTIRRLGIAKPLCTGGKDLRYRPTADPAGAPDLPTVADFSLDQWTDGARPPCVEAIADEAREHGGGMFEMESCIYIEEGMLIGTKRVCAISVFPYPRTPARSAAGAPLWR